MRHFQRAAFLLVALAAACSSNPDEPSPLRSGTLKVGSVTSGESPDPDGYVVNVTGQQDRRIAANGEANFPGLPAGFYTVSLGGLASNCVVLEAPSQLIKVLADGISRVEFRVACPTPSEGGGDLEIIVSTTYAGTGWSPGGWFPVKVDTLSYSVPDNGSIIVSPLSAGKHTVHLVANYCFVSSVAGELFGDTVTATVPEGGLVQVRFDVWCLP